MARLLIFVAFVALVFGASTGRCSTVSFPAQSIQLKDGSVMTFSSADYAQRHIRVSGGLADRLVAGAAVRLGFKPPKNAIVMTSTNNTLALWCTWTNRQIGTYPPEIALEDSDGYCSAVHPVSFIPSPPRSTAPVTGFFLVTAFPRRSKTVTIHFFQHDPQLRELGKITIPQPASEKFPDWKPDPLPVTAHDGDLEVTLTRLVANAHVDSIHDFKAATGPTNVGFYMELNFTRNGAPATHWKVITPTVTDATGNERRPGLTAWFEQPEKLQVWSESNLWPDEPAWKLNLELSRDAEFATDEWVTFKSLPVSTNPLNQTATVNGRTVTVTALETKAHFTRQTNYSYRATIKISPRVDDYDLTALEARNEHGERLRPTGGDEVTKGVYYRFFEGTNAATTMDIKLAVRTRRFVEFTVKPEILK